MPAAQAKAPEAPKTFTVSADYVAVIDPALTSGVSDAQVVPLWASVAFRPRLPAGFVAYVSDFPVTADVNAVQMVSVLGAVTGGTWILLVGTAATDPIAWDASPADLQSALEAHPDIGAGGVAVTAGPNPRSYLVEFTGTLGSQVVPLMGANGSQLVGPLGTSQAVTVVNQVYGAEARRAPAGVVIAPRQGRLWSGRLRSVDVEDSLDVELVANDPILALASQGIPDLIYDVDFTYVVWAGQPGVLRNFAFAAPADGTPVSLTDPALVQLPWQRP